MCVLLRTVASTCLITSDSIVGRSQRYVLHWQHQCSQTLVARLLHVIYQLYNGCGMLDGLALISALCACCFARLHPSACYLGFNSGSVPKVCSQNAASNSTHILQLIACVRFCQYCPALVAPLSPCEALSARWGAATPGHCLHMGALRSAPHLASYYLSFALPRLPKS